LGNSIPYTNLDNQARILLIVNAEGGLGTNTIIRKKYHPGVAMLIFVFITVIAGMISEMYQAPQNDGTQFNRYISLFSTEKLLEINKISIENKLGKFVLNKNEHQLWELSSPNKLPANPAPIEGIISSLRAIKVRKIYKADAINLSNFSIDNPNTIVTLTTPQGESNQIKYGITNSIDPSTYIQISGTEDIYQIDAIGFTTATLSLNDLIDSSVFYFNTDEVKSIKVNKYQGNSKSLKIHIIRQNNLWVNNREKELDQKKTEEFITELKSVRSQMILDVVDQKITDEINAQLEKPTNSIDIEFQDGNTETYYATALLKALPGLKIEKQKNFIVKSSTKPFSYLVDKDNQKIFNVEQKQFETIAIKKLFY